MRLVLTATATALLAAIPAYADDRSECLSGIDRLRSSVARAAPAGRGELERKLRKAEGEAAEREFGDCVSVLKARSGEADRKSGDDDDEAAETEDMFGFTQGSSILEKGKVEISGEYQGAFGKRMGRYRASALTSTLAFGLIEGLSIEFGATGNTYATRNVPELDNRNGGGFSGISTELKWQAIKRSATFPVGLTFVVEPTLNWRDADSGGRGRGAGLEARIVLDAELIPKTLFGAVNLTYELEKFRSRGRTLFNAEGEPLEGVASGACPSGEAEDEDVLETCVASARRLSAERSSLLGISGALAVQIRPSVFLGGEVRYLRSYAGLGLNRFEGHAVFVGPTLYAKLSENVSISAAFSTQVGGSSKATPGRRLDLDNFSRHQAKLKISYEF